MDDRKLGKSRLVRRAGRGVAVLVIGAAGVFGLSAPAGAEECDPNAQMFGCPPPEPELEVPEQQPQPDPSGPRPRPTVEDHNEEAGSLLNLVNDERTARGLPRMAMRDDVSQISRPHSRDMATQQRIWHNDAYFTDETRRRLDAKALGENVAMNLSVAKAHDALMKSEGHRRNILDPRFTVIGIGISVDTRGYYYVTQSFVQPRVAAPSTAAPAPRPASATAPKPAPAPRPAAAAPAAVEPVTLAHSEPTPIADREQLRPRLVGLTSPLSLRPVDDASTDRHAAVLWAVASLFVIGSWPVLRLAVVRTTRRR